MTLEPRGVGRYALYGETLAPCLLSFALLACGSAHSSPGSGSSSGSGGAGASTSASSGSTSAGGAAASAASSSTTSSSGSGGASTSSSTSTSSSSSGSPPPAGAPLVLYTDVTAGPTSGGEDGKGAYLSIFGKNFGTTGLGTTVKVTIGGSEVAGYRSIGASVGRSDVQQITVQIGALGTPKQGTALPVVVTVSGTASNADQTFTPNPGRMIFVDNANGDDATAVPGDITHPFQHVQLPGSSATATGVSKPGDTIVLRGTGTPYADLGNANQFVRVIGYGGSAPTGASGTGPLAFIGYPGETVQIVNGKGGLSDGAAFSSFDHTSGSYTGGNWVTIADLHVEGDGGAGMIALQTASDHWRIVNDELSSPDTGGTTVLAGGVNGNGTNIAIFGNSIHDITGMGGESHGIYVDGDGSYEMAYNVIYDVASGYGIQVYDDEGSSPTISHVHVHHNYLHDVTGKGCLNIGTGSADDLEYWDNVCAHINLECLRLDVSGTLSGAKLFNNTFYDCGSGDAFDGAVDNDSDQITPAMATIVNTIVWSATGVPYTGGSGSGFASGVFQSDLFYNAGNAPSGTGNVSGNPDFVSATDLHLASGSPAKGAGSSSVSGLVVNDYDLVPWGAGPYDIGAY